MLKPGDKLLCIEGSNFTKEISPFGNVVQDKIYTFKRYIDNKRRHEIFLEEIQDSWGVERFKLVKSTFTNTTLPTDSNERKEYPLHRGCFRYFPAALAGVAKISKLGNDKHNPGEEIHHARGKSGDHGDCVLRHLTDVEDLIAAKERGDTTITTEQILNEVNQMAWRVLALSQELHEKFGAPLAPGAKK